MVDYIFPIVAIFCVLGFFVRTQTISSCLLLISGKGTLTINNTEYTFGANQAFLIRPEQLAIYTADSSTPWEYYYFAFSGAFSSELVENTVFRNRLKL